MTQHHVASAGNDAEQVDIKPHQYEVFRAVAQHLSYVRAAEALYLSQPAVSQQIKALEARLGLRLFARRGRGIALTSAGERLLPGVERVLSLLAETSSVTAQIHAVQRGSVVIGASKSTGAYVVPRLLADFHETHPQIRLTLKVADRLSIEEDLLSHQIDLAVIGLVKHHERFVVDWLMSNDLIVVAPPQHRLAGHSSIPLRELQWEPFLLREPGSGTRLDTERLLAEAGISLNAAQELGDTGAIKQAVGAGLGITVLFRQSVADEIARGELIELNVVGFPLERRWHMVRARDRRLSTAAAAFHTHILGYA